MDSLAEGNPSGLRVAQLQAVRVVLKRNLTREREMLGLIELQDEAWFRNEKITAWEVLRADKIVVSAMLL